MLESDDVSLTLQRIEIFKTEIEHLICLVRNLKILAQIEGGSLEIQPESLQPSALLEKIYGIYQPIAARQEVELMVNAPESMPSISVDSMLQVLKNLVDNVLRYTPSGGKITLGAGFDGQVPFRVSDTGPGIDAEELSFVFVRFYCADKVRAANTGKLRLELSICTALVTVLGGAIGAQSAGKDQGTTITITFPPDSE